MLTILSCYASGSYDHSLKVWDLRSQGSVLSMDHGSPVECVQIFPSGGICISAGKRIREEVKNTMMVHVIYRAESPQGDIIDRTIIDNGIFCSNFLKVFRNTVIALLVAAHQQSFH